NQPSSWASTILLSGSHREHFCDVTTAVGDPVTIELQYSGFTQDNELIWKHGDTKVFEKRKGTVIIGSKENVTSGGSLILHSVQMDQKGPYSAEVYDSTTGKELHKAVKNLCVTDPLSKPRVSRDCSKTQCLLVCVGEETKYTRYSWKENGKTTPGNTLTVQKTGDRSKSYTCVFSNPKSEEHSDPLTHMDLFPGFTHHLNHVLNSFLPKDPPIGAIRGGIFAGVLFILIMALLVFLAIRWYRLNRTKRFTGRKKQTFKTVSLHCVHNFCSSNMTGTEL
uniref:Ig-like domain-containing protein n=1 Tax=Scleropages formosus TaxID=113540 RepID=A0A8C9TVE0_SCLFO